MDSAIVSTLIENGKEKKSSFIFVKLMLCRKKYVKLEQRYIQYGNQTLPTGLFRDIR